MEHKYSRREVIKMTGCAAMGMLMPALGYQMDLSREIQSRPIPVSGEKLPIVGLGTWQTFDVGNSRTARAPLITLLEAMNEMGGTFIDSSPMYGSSEQVVGDLTQGMSFQNDFFYATKVWTTGLDAGINQMNRSFSRMNRDRMDLMQIHNLVDWKTHSKTLRKMKEDGKIRYWGVTHYTDAAHVKIAEIVKAERPDFIQFNYSIRSRNAEKELFDIAEKYNTAVVINRPFEGGSLFNWSRGKQLPYWVKEFGIESWAQFFLKFILSQNTVNCVIPGTSKPHHLIDNMKAGFGNIPDEHTRIKMAKLLNS